MIRQLWSCLRGGGDALSSILIGFFPAAVATVCWWFAVRWLFANRRKRTTSAPLGNVTEWPDAMKSAPSPKINAVFESAQRIVAMVVAIPFTAFALLLLWSDFRGGANWQEILPGFFPVTVAIICWAFALRGHIAESRRRTTAALVGGVMLGGIGFAAAFGLGILTNNSMAPVAGIFMTGPLGFVLGAIIGWLYARNRASKQKSS
jgi:hypothetical protein